MEHIIGGYNNVFQQAPPEELICCKCRLVARDPQQTYCSCKQLYCKSCLEALEKKSENCPKCLAPFNAFPNALRAMKIKVLSVKCDMQSNGCKWIGPLWQLEAHLSSCNFSEVSCTNSTCSHQTLRKNLSGHLLNECPQRYHQCPHCKMEGEHFDITGPHAETCPEREVSCPHIGCGKTMQQSKLVDNHLQVCPKSPVECSFRDLGCMEVCAGNLDEHNKEFVTHHLSLVSASLTTQGEKLRELEQKLYSQVQDTVQQEPVEIEARCQALESKQQAQNVAIEDITACLQQQLIRVPSFFESKLANAVWYSPAFYCKGYKLCLCVHPNGNRSAKDVYLSVFVHAMKGMNDDSLQWPLTAQVSLQLLNQIADKRHLNKSLHFKSERITSDEKGVGQGFDKFIAHNVLSHNAAYNTQYVMNDCIFFKVSVRVMLEKPWLMC